MCSKLTKQQGGFKNVLEREKYNKLPGLELSSWNTGFINDINVASTGQQLNKVHQSGHL